MNNKIWKFIEKYKYIIFMVLITCIALYARILMIDYRSGDYEMFLEEWYYTLKLNGGLSALKLDIGNYNMPYLTVLAILTYLPIKPIYAIKIFSIIFDFVCAFAVGKIVANILEKHKNKLLFSIIAYGVVLFLPTVLLNSAYWAQSDAIYTAFILLAILSLLKENYLKAFIYLGISFSIKLQFIFILPLFILIYLSERKFPLYYFFIIPLVNFVMCIPSILFGKSIIDCFKIYQNQINAYDYLSLNFPNIYSLLFESSDTYVYSPADFFPKIGIAITIFVFVLMAFIVFIKKVKFNKQQIIEFGLWSILTCTFLLPSMHDRYLFAGDILSIIYFLYNKDKIYVPIGVSLISFYGYKRLLLGQVQFPIQYISFIYLIIMVIITKDIYNKYLSANDNMV